MTYDKKVVLVTWCAGFIWSNLCDELVKLWRTVVGVDSFLTGHKKNMEKLLDDPNFVFVEADIREKDAMEDIIKKYNIQYISHQAARASVPKSVEDPLLTNDINVNGTLNLLRLAKEYQIKKFVCAISSSVYGNTPTLPKVETMPYRPESPYAISKVTKEMYCKVFYTLYGVPTIWLRYFNVYGPRQDPNGAYAAVVPRWIDAALHGTDLPLNGEGKQTRDFTYIHDVVDVNIKALTCENTDARGKWYNIAYGDSISIQELGEIIIDTTKADSKIVKAPERQGDIQDSFGDISLARDLLWYEPQTSIYQGIEKTITWYEHHQNYFSNDT